MTTEQKRIKIAEACGWREEHREQMRYLRGQWTSPEGDYKPIPDYFNDLNACHEMEKVLTRGQWYDYGWRLSEMIHGNDEDRFNDMDNLGYRFGEIAHATAAQRAEAFGLTLGLWKEGE